MRGMDDTDAPLKKYEVEITGSFSTWVEVEAEDEDDAHDAANQAVSSYGSWWTGRTTASTRSLTSRR